MKVKVENRNGRQASTKGVKYKVTAEVFFSYFQGKVGSASKTDGTDPVNK